MSAMGQKATSNDNFEMKEAANLRGLILLDLVARVLSLLLFFAKQL
jgi:hypothetical protein